MTECTACQTIQTFGSFRLSSLTFWRQSFVPNEESFFLSDDLWLLICTYVLFSGPKALKLRPHVMNMHCIYQAGMISVCFDQINEVSKYFCLFIFLNLYIIKISLINSKYMYDIENKKLAIS